VFRKNYQLTDDVPGDILRGRDGFRTNDYFHGGFSVRRRYGRGEGRVRDCISVMNCLGSRTCEHISRCLCCVMLYTQLRQDSANRLTLPVSAVPVVCRAIVVSAKCRLYRRKESYWITGFQTPVAYGGPGGLVMSCMVLPCRSMSFWECTRRRKVEVGLSGGVEEDD
jgi:hypothetical protein